MKRFLAFLAFLLLLSGGARADFFDTNAPGSGGGGGGSTSITAANACVVVTPSPITATGTVGLTVPDNSKTASYSVAAGDMCGALNLTATTGTPTLTLPAVSPTIFQPGMTTTVAITGTVNWTVTNSSGLTLSTGFPTTFYPGMNGTIVANADGTHLDWFGSPVGSTTVAGVYKVDGTTVLATAGVLSSTGGGGITCDTGFSVVGASCAWTQTNPVAGSGQSTTANCGSSFACWAWTGLTKNEYTLRCSNLLPATTTNQFAIQYGEGGTPTWKTASGDYLFTLYAVDSTAPNPGTGQSHSTDAGFIITNGGMATSGVGGMFDANFHALQAANFKPISLTMLSNHAGATFGATVQGSYSGDTTAITAIRVIDTTGTSPSTGSCTLYEIGP